MRLVVPLLSLLLFSCSSKPTVWDWAPVRAPPVPGVGLPQPGMPLVVKPAPQPNPKPSRVLPQTPETMKQPGIWAGDEPNASLDDAPVVDVLGVPLALPAFRDPELDIGVAHDCRDRLPRGFAIDPGLKELVARLSPEERMCWVATVIQFCAHLRLQDYIGALRSEGITIRREDTHGRSLRGLFDGAKQLRDLMCPGLDERKMNALKTRWENLELGQPKGMN